MSLWRLSNEWLEEIWINGSVLSGLDATDTLSGCGSVTVLVGLVVHPVGLTIFIRDSERLMSMILSAFKRLTRSNPRVGALNDENLDGISFGIGSVLVRAFFRSNLTIWQFISILIEGRENRIKTFGFEMNFSLQPFREQIGWWSLCEDGLCDCERPSSIDCSWLFRRFVNLWFFLYHISCLLHKHKRFLIIRLLTINRRFCS